METKYKCNACGWKGVESELEQDNVETCGGNDITEVCPNCGSMNVVPVYGEVENG